MHARAALHAVHQRWLHQLGLHPKVEAAALAREPHRPIVGLCSLGRRAESAEVVAHALPSDTGLKCTKGAVVNANVALPVIAPLPVLLFLGILLSEAWVELCHAECCSGRVFF